MNVGEDGGGWVKVEGMSEARGLQGGEMKVKEWEKVWSGKKVKKESGLETLRA